MRSSTLKWLVGSVSFFLPAITVAVTNWILRQSSPAAFWTSIAVAAVIPPALVLSSKGVKWRIAFALGLWVLLGVEFCLILICLLAGFRE